MHSTRILSTLIAAVVCTCFASSRAQAEDAAAPDYTKHIAPLFAKYCNACHDADAAEGKLVMDSFAALMNGGEHGPAVLPGDAAASRLYRMLTGQAAEKMPPKDNPAPKPEEIALIKQWIDAGAKGPSGEEPQRTLLVPKIAPATDMRPITALATSPDGKLLAVARFGEVEMLDATNNASLRKFADHPGKVTAVTFSADSKQLVTASGIDGLSGEARLFNATNGTLIRSFKGHRDIAYAATLSPDGKLLATCSYDRRAILWNAATGEQIRVLEGHNDAVYDVAFNRDGTLLATASGDNTVKIWHAATGERFDTLSQPFKEQYAVQFSADGKFIVAAGADNRLRAWDLVSREKPAINPLQHARFAHEGAIVRIALSPDGKLLATAADDRTVKLWETGNYTQTHVFKDQSDKVAALAFSSEGNQLHVGRMDGSLAKLDIPASARKRVRGPRLPNNEESEEEVATAEPATDPDDMKPAAEKEPNDELKSATELRLPGIVTGVIDAGKRGGRDEDLFRIACKKGEQWVLEINAARNKSPLDSRLEVLDADGKPVLRLLLEAVRDSYITFRGIDSMSRDVRVFGWQEMDLGQWMYFQGEVCKTGRMPQGPDSGFQLFPADGNRHSYFDTTPTTHAMGEPCYVVEPRTPGETIIPNGLPVFPLYFENDDDGLRRTGRDSRLTFTAPDDGEYYIRLTDTRGFAGKDYKYTLTARRRKPDLAVALTPREMSVPAGGAKSFKLTLDRRDEYEGEVRVEMTGTAPPGWQITSPLIIENDMLTAEGVIVAAADAKQPTDEEFKAIQFTATGKLNGKEVSRPVASFTSLKLDKKPKLTVELLPAPTKHGNAAADAVTSEEASGEIVIAPGQTLPALLRVKRDGFDGRINLDVNNLPFGIIVANIGLNKVLIRENETDRLIQLEAAPWVAEGEYLIHAVAQVEGNQASPPVVLRVKKAATP